MREAFTETLRKAFRKADEQARGLRQEFVGTEHLLLGILAGNKGEAIGVLKGETDLDELRARLTKSLPHAPKDPRVTGRLPLSPHAQRALNAAIASAQAAGQHSVSTRMMLLALLADPESAISATLRDSGADVEELPRLLKQSGGETEP